MPSAYRDITGVALRAVRYNDRAWILTVWTREYGRMSLTVNAGAGAESRRRRALTMPMSLFEAVAAVKPGMEVVPVRDLRPHVVCQDIGANPVKSAVAMFMAEVLGALLRESRVGDQAVWAAIKHAVQALEAANARETAFSPLWFMALMCRVLGVAPDTGTWHQGYWLDLTDGVFRASRPLPPHGFMEPAEARIARILTDAPLRRVSELPLDSAMRRRALDAVLRYMGLHLQPLTGLRTLPILHSLLH